MFFLGFSLGSRQHFSPTDRTPAGRLTRRIGPSRARASRRRWSLPWRRTTRHLAWNHWKCVCFLVFYVFFGFFWVERNQSIWTKIEILEAYIYIIIIIINYYYHSSYYYYYLLLFIIIIILIIIIYYYLLLLYIYTHEIWLTTGIYRNMMAMGISGVVQKRGLLAMGLMYDGNPKDRHVICHYVNRFLLLYHFGIACKWPCK